MVSGKHKSRTYKRVKIRTPGGTVKIHFRKRAPAKAKCGVCKQELHGVPRKRPFQMRALPKTKKRPERPYGGVLCSKCMRQQIINKLE
ncbi:50S ribosomal protein L34e [Candidatus Woesearchaeota archaeon CG10_big_fil_rev_8_21_14_0_10_30_7]|nr:MAG: 50S ribosomal protein L34e [Candidatus Woesearchaeota archaeon CG10_big_fil_rev_8_21_14_0_10_30_7]